ncbi:MAG: anaerobic ribonucleoside-triphosphate reductase activating protein [Thermodesulfobacteriota bacterium]
MEIKGFIEASFLDWPGKVCSVLFLPSCNLRCPFCHNHELVLHPGQLPTYPFAYIKKRLKALGGWLDGVCVSGGEPTLHRDLPELLQALRDLGLAVKLDSNGTRPEVLEDLIFRGLIDYLAMDVKGPLEDEAYGRCSGTPISLSHIRRSMDLIRSGRVRGEFRTTVIPEWHTPAVLDQMGWEIGDRYPWIRQEFNPSQAMAPALRAV